jgi:hypothetical protein
MAREHDEKVYTWNVKKGKMLIAVLLAIVLISIIAYLWIKNKSNDDPLKGSVVVGSSTGKSVNAVPSPSTNETPAPTPAPATPVVVVPTISATSMRVTFEGGSVPIFSEIKVVDETGKNIAPQGTISKDLSAAGSSLVPRQASEDLSKAFDELDWSYMFVPHGGPFGKMVLTFSTITKVAKIVLQQRFSAVESGSFGRVSGTVVELMNGDTVVWKSDKVTNASAAYVYNPAIATAPKFYKLEIRDPLDFQVPSGETISASKIRFVQNHLYAIAELRVSSNGSVLPLTEKNVTTSLLTMAGTYVENDVTKETFGLHRMFDGNINTFFHPNGSTTPVGSTDIDLGREMPIDEIVVTSRYTEHKELSGSNQVIQERAQNFKIQLIGADGSIKWESAPVTKDSMDAKAFKAMPRTSNNLSKLIDMGLQYVPT